MKRYLKVEAFEFDPRPSRTGERKQPAKSQLRLKGKWLANILPPGSTVVVMQTPQGLLIAPEPQIEGNHAN